MSGEDGNKQLLNLVFGGELKSLSGTEFRDLDALDIVGTYPNYRTAWAAWKAKAQAGVDNAHMRYSSSICTGSWSRTRKAPDRTDG